MNISELLTQLLLALLTIGSILVFLYVYLQRRNYLKTLVSEAIENKIVLKIAVPKNNDKKPMSAEQFFQSLHGILRGTSKSPDHFSFELVGTQNGIFFLVICNERYKKFIENQIYAQYPEAQITPVHDYVKSVNDASNHIFVSELGLVKDYFLPIKTFQNFDVDPLAAITGTISKMDLGSEAWIQILARPIANEWQEKGRKYVDSIRNKRDDDGRKVDFESGQKEEIFQIERKAQKLGFQFIIRILSKSQDPVMAEQVLHDIEASFRQFQAAPLNEIGKVSKPKEGIFSGITRALYGQRKADQLNPVQKYVLRFLDEREVNILNTEEIASIFHLPSSIVQTPNIAWALSKKLEIPQNIPTQNARMFAVTDYRSTHIPFGIKKEDRRRHMYILGKTGTGKSTLIKNMIAGDIIDGEGFAFLDPHGDAVEEILDLIPAHRIKDVIYLDPSDTEFPIGLNMLDLKEGESLELLADGIVSVFKKYFDSWGPRLQYILTNTILTLLHCQNVSLLAVQRILVDTNYRKFLLKQVKDPFLLNFWENEYVEMSRNPRLITEAIAPIQNKVGRFLSSPLVRNMFGQVKASLNLQDVMNEGKILLVNLSQGKIGEENSSLLGGMIVTRLYTNAMQRAKIHESNRKDFYLYVDEFQNFATDSFVKILSEARKYGLNLIVTHQYIDQLNPSIQDAIFGNVGTLTNFVVGPKDAHRLEREFTPYLTSEDLVNLERHRMTLKLTVDGSQTRPFTAISMTPNYIRYNLSNEAKSRSRESYASSRSDVETKLNKWASQKYDDRGNLIQHN